MGALHQCAVICIIYLSSEANLACAKFIKVQIQAVTSGAFLNPLSDGTPNVGFGNDDTVIWNIDWDEGIRRQTVIKTSISGDVSYIGHVYGTPNRITLEIEKEFASPWKINSTYREETGRFHHKFILIDGALMQCINGPNGLPTAPPQPVLAQNSLSPCLPEAKEQEFFVTHVD